MIIVFHDHTVPGKEAPTKIKYYEMRVYQNG